MVLIRPDTIAVLASCFLTVLAVPAAKRCTPEVVKQDANFEDVNCGVPGVTFANIPSGYKGLLWQGFTCATGVKVTVPGVGVSAPGVLPHSPHNFAAASSVSETNGGNVMLTTNYAETNTATFDLNDLYYGCATNLMNAATDLPAKCLISITGYKGSDNTVAGSYEVCSQQLQYDPSTITGSQEMAFSQTLDSCFKGVSYVIFTFNPPGGLAGTAPLLALVVDSVNITTHGNNCQ